MRCLRAGTEGLVTGMVTGGFTVVGVVAAGVITTAMVLVAVVGATVVMVVRMACRGLNEIRV